MDDGFVLGIAHDLMAHRCARVRRRSLRQPWASAVASRAHGWPDRCAMLPAAQSPLCPAPIAGGAIASAYMSLEAGLDSGEMAADRQRVLHRLVGRI